jgi:soluble lytic murein transglycosylase-like protein
MLTLFLKHHAALRNISVRYFCLLILTMPAFAAAAERITTVVHADEKSGRLIRALIVTPRQMPVAVSVTGDSSPSETAAAPDIETLVSRIAGEQGVEESLIHSVIRAESNYNPYAISPKGAQGLMQLIPATARRFGVGNTFDPQENIRGGVKYLKFLLEYYQGDYAKAIAAYNAGEKAVDKYHGVPPYPETQNYVVQVAKNLKTARSKRAARPASDPQTVASTGSPETNAPPPASVGSDGRVYYRTP